jgi:glycosyltransferase involved in cell wall biosynthesis
VSESQVLRRHGGPILHWAGRVTDEVFSFLGPASAALAASGVDQTIVLCDEPRYRHLLTRFHKSVRLALTPADANLYRRWRLARSAFVAELHRSAPATVHLHGSVPYLLSLTELSRLPAGRVVCYSPHGSRALRSWALPAGLLRPLLEAAPRHLHVREIANAATDLRRLRALMREPVGLVESQVAEVYFQSARAEAERPLILTGSRIPAASSVDLFSRLAVLLGDERLGARFGWLGSLAADLEAQLRSAQVEVLDETDDARRAEHLGRAWAFLATQGTDGFPLFLAEAMASGVPCVAVDTPFHRDLIDHGKTGYLFKTDEELMHCMAMLLDSGSLRQQLGCAAREMAERRFSGHRFRDSMFNAYGPDVVEHQAEVSASRPVGTHLSII